MPDLSPDPAGSPPPPPSEPWNPTPRERGELAGRAVYCVGELIGYARFVRQTCERDAVAVPDLLEPLNNLVESIHRAEALCRDFRSSLNPSNRPSLDPSLSNTLEASVRRGRWVTTIAVSFGVDDTEAFPDRGPLPFRPGVGPLVAAAILTPCPELDDRAAINDIRREVAEWLRFPVCPIGNPFEGIFEWATYDYLDALWARGEGWVHKTDQQRLESLQSEAGAESPPTVPEWITNLRAPQQRTLIQMLWGRDWLGEQHIIRAMRYEDSANPRDAIEKMVREANKTLTNLHLEIGEGWAIRKRTRNEQLQLLLARLEATDE